MSLDKFSTTPSPLQVVEKVNDVIDALDAGSFDGYWEAGESVEVGDIRYVEGRDNVGLVLECVQAGTTGSSAPAVSDEDIEPSAPEASNLNEFEGVLGIEKGGTGATTASEACANIGALPLSGGTMQGNLHFEKGAEICGVGRDGYAKLCGGSKNEDGARCVFYGVEYGAESNAYKGIFQLVASDANGNYSTLFGYPNGTLTWNGKSLLVSGQGGNTVSITTGTISNNGTIPLPSGYTRAQCKYAAWIEKKSNSATGMRGAAYVQITQSSGAVKAYYEYDGSWNALPYTLNGATVNATIGYLCIAVK